MDSTVVKTCVSSTPTPSTPLHLKTSTLVSTSASVVSMSSGSRKAPRNLMKEKVRRGSAYHCINGVCKSDNRYPESLPDSWMDFFAKPDMDEWQVKQANAKTEKYKRCVHAIGRENFSVANVNKHRYICSLHFVHPTKSSRSCEGHTYAC